MSTHHRTLNASDVISTPRLSDEQIAHYAREYQRNNKIKLRMPFVQFISNPALFLERSKAWPDSAWTVSFVSAGSHKKMWINDRLSGRTLSVDVIHTTRNEAVIDVLETVSRQYGLPDTAYVEDSQCVAHEICLAFFKKHSVHCVEVSTKQAEVA